MARTSLSSVHLWISTSPSGLSFANRQYPICSGAIPDGEGMIFPAAVVSDLYQYVVVHPLAHLHLTVRGGGGGEGSGPLSQYSARSQSKSAPGIGSNSTRSFTDHSRPILPPTPAWP